MNIASSQVAFRMQLKPGCASEYERRHLAIWPELRALLSSAGIHDYSIFLDSDGTSLFAVMRVRPGFSDALLSQHPMMRRWWRHMSDLMVVEDDKRPVQWPMQRVFRLSEPSDEAVREF